MFEELPPWPLWPAQRDVLLCLVNGLSVGETAVLLQKSPHTVRVQRRQALKAIGARNAVHAAAMHMQRVQASTQWLGIVA